MGKLRVYAFSLIVAFVLVGCGQPRQSLPASTAWASPLPHSAKGYELYSRPAEVGQQWVHILITGTNRLKTQEEIVAAEDTVSESGWVRVSATGTEELKALLSQLPDGESVTWIGGNWLEQTGGPGGSIQLPPESVMEEVERHCRQAGVSLSVARR